MRTQIRDEDTSTFRIRRSILKTNGIGSEVDQNVTRLLKEIDELLGKPVFGRSTASAKPAAKRKAAAAAPVTASPTAAAGVTGAASPSATTMGAPAALAGAPAAPASAPGGVAVSSAPIEIRNFFDLVLSAKHSPKGAGDATSWDSGNLSTHCTGMATVISPALDAELNFILERLLKHDEVLQQVLPEGGNWKRAVDKLNQERRRPAGSAMTLYNKAVLGKDIIEMIANYVPSDFERNSAFSDFIGKVDAYITTQSMPFPRIFPCLRLCKTGRSSLS